MYPQIIVIITSGALMLTLMSFLTSMVVLRKARRLRRVSYALETDFEHSLSEFSRDLDTLSRKTGEQSRRIAWLETRARTGHEQPVAVEMASGANSKPNITERRHRVRSLARRGQDALTIAQTLGMPYGEVELMINLLKAA